MAWINEWKKRKNITPISFQERLLSLMFDSNEDIRVNTTLELAEKLRESYFWHEKNGVKIYKYQVSSIDQKIKEHLTEGTSYSVPKCVNVDYIQAYAQYFKCSTDYLFGTTPYKTDSIEIRKICELTGLSEKVITKFVNDNSSTKNIPQKFNSLLSCYESNSKFWIDILNNEDTFIKIPLEWNNMLNALNKIKELDSTISNVNAYLENKDSDNSNLPKYRAHDINFITESPSDIIQSDNFDTAFNEMLQNNIPIYQKNKDNYLDIFYGRMQNLLTVLTNYLNQQKDKILNK